MCPGTAKTRGEVKRVERRYKVHREEQRGSWVKGGKEGNANKAEAEEKQTGAVEGEKSISQTSIRPLLANQMCTASLKQKKQACSCHQNVESLRPHHPTSTFSFIVPDPECHMSPAYMWVHLLIQLLFAVRLSDPKHE